MMVDHGLRDEAIEDYPLSPLQAGMLFHYVQGGRGTGVDIEQLEGWLHEPVDPTTWQQAWRAVASQHAALRTRFRWEGIESPRQEVVADIDVPLSFEDLSGLSTTQQTTRLDAYRRDDRHRGFDLSSAPLWRIALFRLAAAEHRMVWTYSHAILDSSYAEVVREVFDAYAALRLGDQPRLTARPTYGDHVRWLHRELPVRADEARAFWRRRLAGFRAPTNLEALQIAAPRTAQPDDMASHDTLRLSLSTETSAAIQRLAGEHSVRVSTFAEAAWALVLGAFSDAEDVVFGSTRAGRRSSGGAAADSTVGLLINTLPVRAQIPPDKPLLTLLSELRAEQVAMRPFEHTPLVDVLAQTDLARGTSLFDTILVFNQQGDDALLKSFGAAWQRRDFELHDQTNFPFNVMAYDGPRISFKLSYARSRFERAAVERIAELLTELFDAMARQPQSAIGDLPRLPRSDALQLDRFNATARPIGEPLCIHESFEQQVDRSPNATALAFRGRSLTFRQLDERANRVANELVRSGVGPDTMVGLYVERSLEMVVGMLAILKAGGAYVPMDPAYPRDRLAIMLGDTRAPIVLTVGTLAPNLPPTDARLLILDAEANTIPATRPRSRATGDSLAYVIFTSGSTGRPKGVQVEHRNVANFFEAMDGQLSTRPGVWLALTSISFDISVLEILWTLSRGFKVVIQEEPERTSAAVQRLSSRPRPIGFSLFYFAADAGDEVAGKYRLLLEGARFADTHDFEAIWTPERHFHPFGGLYPNPAVTGAALAVATNRIQIRAGSVVLPLHNPIRCAEEWSVVDNLSNGRVGLSFASGWHASDFALAPDNFHRRRELMAEGIEIVRALWRGEQVAATSGDGTPTQVRMYPPPVQREPRVWLTASRSSETFALAGRWGAAILTNLLVMSPDELVTNIKIYRAAYRAAGHVGDGHVTLMLHTFVGQNEDDVRARVRQPFMEYLRTSTDLINKARWDLTAFARADDHSASSGVHMDLDELSPDDLNALLDHAFERYFASAGLFGTPDSCLATVERWRDNGIDEIACLLDFGLDTDSVLASLPQLDALRRLSNPAGQASEGSDDEDYGVAAQIRRHKVTHLQCTPSLLSLLVADDDAADALGDLQMLLVGGEALSAGLVERVQPRLNGTLRNMYGPTEATVWSTTSIVRAGSPITVGAPIANTRIRITDRKQRELPVGVAGELLIGGAGVVRGYLERPELTAERFIRDASGAPGERLYRTGDLARWLPSGEIEFIGRLDQQIKLRGYRIELGEIESVLAAHAAVRDSVVVAREVAAGDIRLVAYIVPRRGPTENDTRALAAEWQTTWDETYRDSVAVQSDLDTSGWRSSFTGETIPQAEMQEWVDATVERILQSAQPSRSGTRVLEIGSGTGMLLLRIAPHVASYTAIDFSTAAIARVQAQVEARGIRNVVLEQLAADELSRLSDHGAFDLIILNSVAQYFPHAGYLVHVLTTAVERLAPGGLLFVGDVRSLRHLTTFHTAVELARAEDSLPLSTLAGRVRQRAADEEELVLDPRFFEALAAQLGNASLVWSQVKAGRAHNEMTSFRFDALLRKGAPTALDPPRSWPSVVAAKPWTLDTLGELLRDEPPALRVEGIPNARLVGPVRAESLLTTSVGHGTVADLRAAASAAGGMEPDDLRALRPDYETIVEFSLDHLDQLNVLFYRAGSGQQIVPVHSRGPMVVDPLTYANRPSSRARAGSNLMSHLRDHARKKLPEYMVPSTFVMLDELPLTPNGKVDRGALPAPDRARAEAMTQEPPTNDLERHIIGVLKDLIGLDEFGVDDNFFDSGANSLLMVQASMRLRTVLGRNIPLVRLFQFPTARLLAAALATGDTDQHAAVKQSQDRAQIRRDAIQRARETRTSRANR